MNRPFRWAIAGSGGMARHFGRTLQAMGGAGPSLIWGRQAGPARALASELGAAAVHGPADALLAASGFDGVYVAATNDAHFAIAARCLQAGHPVLCEKPLTASYAATIELLALAARHRVFLMEALWTRMLPAYTLAGDLLAGGAIGRLRAIRSDFSIQVPWDPCDRRYSPDKGGGALLDVGIYCLAMSRWVMQQIHGACPEPQAIRVSGRRAATGVDAAVDAVLAFPGDLEASFRCAIDEAGPGTLEILGEEGRLLIPSRFWQAEELRLERRGAMAQAFAAPCEHTGLEYEIREAEQCIREGKLSSGRMPPEESLAIARWMDDILHLLPPAALTKAM